MQHSGIRGHTVSRLMSYAVVPALSSFMLSLLTILSFEFIGWKILLPVILITVAFWYIVAFLFVQTFIRIGRHNSIRALGYSAAAGLLLTILSSLSVLANTPISLAGPPSYGYPFVYYIRGWQKSGMLTGPSFLNIALTYFLLDVVFWFIISFLIAASVVWLRKWSVPFLATCFAVSLAIMALTYGISTLMLPGFGTIGGYYHGYPWTFIVTNSNVSTSAAITFLTLGFLSDFIFWFVFAYFLIAIITLLFIKLRRIGKSAQKSVLLG